MVSSTGQALTGRRSMGSLTLRASGLLQSEPTVCVQVHGIACGEALGREYKFCLACHMEAT